MQNGSHFGSLWGSFWLIVAIRGRSKVENRRFLEPNLLFDYAFRNSNLIFDNAILGQNKVPRALSTSDVFLHVQKPPCHEGGVPDFLHKKPSNFETKEGTPVSWHGRFSTTNK